MADPAEVKQRKKVENESDYRVRLLLGEVVRMPLHICQIDD